LKYGYLRDIKFYGIRNRCLAALHFGQGFPYDLLGQARTFAALAGDAGGLAYFAVAAATFKDRIADLSVGDASAEADIHKVRTVAGYGPIAMDLNVNENDCQSGLAGFSSESDKSDERAYFSPAWRVSKLVVLLATTAADLKTIKDSSNPRCMMVGPCAARSRHRVVV
jgi:hypothetical protein